VNPTNKSEVANDTLFWVHRIEWRYPTESSALDAAQLRQAVQEALASCAPLEVNNDYDIFRFVALRVLLNPEQKRSPLIQGALVRTLSNLDWDCTKRLDFVYKHIVGRSVLSPETDFGRDFAPTNQIGRVV
jgi:hypothetical protein